MKGLILGLAFYAAIAISAAHAQMGITFFPGPGTPASAGGGCTMNGTLVLTNSCNNIYYLTGMV